MTRHQPLPTPALILAADHRARAVITTENYRDLVGALAHALPSCDGILATAQPLGDLVAAGHVTERHRTYLSLNRTGLAGSAFELDDRLVTSVGRAARDGWTGIKHMTRIDLADPVTSASTPSPIASTLRLWPSSPVITDTVPDSRPKTTEIQTSHSAAVICLARAWPGAGGWLPGMEPSCLPGSE